MSGRTARKRETAGFTRIFRNFQTPAGRSRDRFRVVLRAEISLVKKFRRRASFVSKSAGSSFRMHAKTVSRRFNGTRGRGTQTGNLPGTAKLNGLCSRPRNTGFKKTPLYKRRIISFFTVITDRVAITWIGSPSACTRLCCNSSVKYSIIYSAYLILESPIVGISTIV